MLNNEFEILEKEHPKKRSSIVCYNGERKKLWACPYCFTRRKREKSGGIIYNECSFGNVDEEKEKILEHMKTCYNNPRKVEHNDKCKALQNYHLNHESKRKIDEKYLMATTAYHNIGDFSYETPDLCCVYEETDGAYIGSFVLGIGAFNVVFPKETTRNLTKDEVKFWSKQYIGIGSQPSHKLNKDELVGGKKQVIVEKVKK